MSRTLIDTYIYAHTPPTSSYTPPSTSTRQNIFKRIAKMSQARTAFENAFMFKRVQRHGHPHGRLSEPDEPLPPYEAVETHPGSSGLSESELYAMAKRELGDVELRILENATLLRSLESNPSTPASIMDKTQETLNILFTREGALKRRIENYEKHPRNRHMRFRK
ncbi:hypothetical protein TWF694_002579 [Orbilia ellipsospora]|uniref:Uncharacterized protein n=1 Tax=Orbilia ellipsospora TaxID=2528407 RepID=A0AAV9X4Y8_9PEZI